MESVVQNIAETNNPCYEIVTGPYGVTGEEFSVRWGCEKIVVLQG
jgi:hypothetical protein